MTVQASLCWTWSKVQIVGFLMTRLIFYFSLPGRDVDSCQCYFTIAAVPSLAPCKPCRDTRIGRELRLLILCESSCPEVKNK